MPSATVHGTLGVYGNELTIYFALVSTLSAHHSSGEKQARRENHSLELPTVSPKVPACKTADPTALCLLRSDHAEKYLRQDRNTMLILSLPTPLLTSMVENLLIVPPGGISLTLSFAGSPENCRAERVLVPETGQSFVIETCPEECICTTPRLGKLLAFEEITMRPQLRSAQPPPRKQPTAPRR